MMPTLIDKMASKLPVEEVWPEDGASVQWREPIVAVVPEVVGRCALKALRR